MTTERTDPLLLTIGTDAGTFERPAAHFREWVTDDGSSAFPAEAGRYHLYVAWACPWSHRVIIGRRLLGLEDVITMSAVSPLRDERGWAFGAGDRADPLHGRDLLSEAYVAADPSYQGRFSVPVLWDRASGRIVNNESADILRMMSTGFGEIGSSHVDLLPAQHLDDIDRWNERLYTEVSNAVYLAGFARDQDLYERLVHRVFATLDELEARLERRRYLFGDSPVETDWRLFVSLVRFDLVYHTLFKFSLRRLADYPVLSAYVRDLYQEHGIADTVRLEECRLSYYTTHPSINPTRVQAVAPAGLDFTAPHGRAPARR